MKIAEDFCNIATVQSFWNSVLRIHKLLMTKMIGCQRQNFGDERLNKNGMSFYANASAVRNRPVFVGAFVDAFHKLTFGFSFQRLAAGLIVNCCWRVVHKWSTTVNRTLGWFWCYCITSSFLVR